MHHRGNVSGSSRWEQSVLDADEVDLSNPQRQIIHSTADIIGKAKGKISKGNHGMPANPDVEVKTTDVRRRIQHHPRTDSRI